MLSLARASPCSRVWVMERKWWLPAARSWGVVYHCAGVIVLPCTVASATGTCVLGPGHDTWAGSNWLTEGQARVPTAQILGPVWQPTAAPPADPTIHGPCTRLTKIPKSHKIPQSPKHNCKKSHLKGRNLSQGLVVMNNKF